MNQEKFFDPFICMSSPFLKNIILLSFTLAFTLSCRGKLHCPDASAKRQFLSARNLYYQNRIEEAFKLLEEIYREYPRYKEAALLYARLLFYSGKVEEAVFLWERIILREEIVDIDAMKLLARYYLRNDQISSAERLLTRALEFSAEDPGLLFLLSETFYRKGNLSTALSLLERADILMERQSELYLKQAMLLRSYGFGKEAARALEKCRVLIGDDHPLADSVENLGKRLVKEIENNSDFPGF